MVDKTKMQTFAEITKPLKKVMKNMREEEVVDMIHRFRTEKARKEII